MNLKKVEQQNEMGIFMYYRNKKTSCNIYY